MFKRKAAANSKVVVIGITGGIATGKSTVAGIFTRERAVLIDADLLGQELLLNHPYIKRSVYEHFGESILNSSRDIDRKKLGNIVFSDHKRLHIYNKIIHPYLLVKIRNQIQRLKTVMKRGIIVVDAALIIEWKLMNLFDYIILVDSLKAKRVQRLAKSKGLNTKEAMERITSQLPVQQKKLHAHFVIENNGTVRTLLAQTKHIIAEIKERSRMAAKK
jgi:dephospho-CoA kinase